MTENLLPAERRSRNPARCALLSSPCCNLYTSSPVRKNADAARVLAAIVLIPTKVPLEKGGSSASRRSSTSCQRRSITPWLRGLRRQRGPYTSARWWPARVAPVVWGALPKGALAVDRRAQLFLEFLVEDLVAVLAQEHEQLRSLDALDHRPFFGRGLNRRTPDSWTHGSAAPPSLRRTSCCTEAQSMHPRAHQPLLLDRLSRPGQKKISRSKRPRPVI